MQRHKLPFSTGMTSRRVETHRGRRSRFLSTCVALLGLLVLGSLMPSAAYAGFQTAQSWAEAVQSPTGDGAGNFMFQKDSGRTEHTVFANNLGRSDFGTTYEHDVAVDIADRGKANASTRITVIYLGEDKDLYDTRLNLDMSGLPKFHVSASATTYGHSPLLQPLPQQAFYGRAHVNWTDTIHVLPKEIALNTLGLAYSFDGSLHASYSAPIADPEKPIAQLVGSFNFGDGRNNINLSINGDQPSAHYSTSGVVRYANLSEGDHQVSLVMEVFASTKNRTGDVTQTASADFANTISILGFIPYDADGNVLPADSVEIQSSFGFIYPVLGTTVNVVPEPGTLTLALLGGCSLIAVALGRRRMSRRLPKDVS